MMGIMFHSLYQKCGARCYQTRYMKYTVEYLSRVKSLFFKKKAPLMVEMLQNEVQYHVVCIQHQHRGASRVSVIYFS